MHSSPFRPTYKRRESYSNRFESDEANDTIKVLPYSDSSARSRLASQHSSVGATRRRSSPFVPYGADTPSSPVFHTPLRKAPSAPSHFSSRLNSDGEPTLLKSDHFSSTGAAFGHFTAPTPYHRMAEYVPKVTTSLPSTDIVRRNAKYGHHLAHSFHEELLRAESQKQDAVLYSEKLQLQLDMQKEENNRLERMIGTLRTELARAGRQAGEAMTENMQQQLQEQSKMMMEQLEYRLSRMQDVLLSEGSSNVVHDVAKRMSGVEDSQTAQMSQVMGLSEKISEFMRQQAQEQRNMYPEALSQIESIRDKIGTLMRREFSELQNTIEKLQDEVAGLRDELDSERQNTEDGRLASAVLSENQLMARNMAAIEKECENLHAENEQLKISARQAESRAEHYVKLANHASELAEIKSKSAGTSDDRQNHTPEGLNSDSALMQQKLDSLQLENKRLTSYQNELLQQLEHVTKQRDRSQEKLQQMEKESDVERSNYESQIHRLRQELSNSSRPNKHLKEEISALKQQLHDKEQKLTLVTTKCNQSESQLQHMTHEFQTGNGRYLKEIQTLEQQIQSLRRELDSKDQQLERFRIDHNKFRDEEKRLRDVIQKQSDTVARLKTEIELVKTDKVQASVGETIRRQSMSTRASLLRSPMDSKKRS
mmetsp:Transcript_98/g.366  ORF Transcript_98/g.366 Transcript_98/m.366 type:complete len:653 (-) Transcript_98:5-1963(-)